VLLLSYKALMRTNLKMIKANLHKNYK